MRLNTFYIRSDVFYMRVGVFYMRVGVIHTYIYIYIYVCFCFVCCICSFWFVLYAVWCVYLRFWFVLVRVYTFLTHIDRAHMGPGPARALPNSRLGPGLGPSQLCRNCFQKACPGKSNMFYIIYGCLGMSFYASCNILQIWPLQPKWLPQQEPCPNSVQGPGPNASRCCFFAWFLVEFLKA